MGPRTTSRILLAVVAVALFAAAATASALLSRDDAGERRRLADDTLSVNFKPDSRTLDGCRRHDARCLQQAFGNLAYREGGASAMAQLERMFAGDTQTNSTCHSIAHFVGFGALRHDRGRVSTTLAAGSDTCSSGYYHGVMTMAFDGVRSSELEQRARALCARPDRRDQGGRECVHGLGHGLMLVTSYDLPRALGVCDRLAQQEQQGCYSGVFMENHKRLMSGSTKWLQEDRPEYPCDAVADRYRTQCYLQVVERVRDAGYDWQRTVDTCARVDVAWRSTCMRFVGYAAAALSADNAAPVLRVCELAAAMEGACVAGAAHTRVAFYQDAAMAGRLCEEASPQAGADCASQIVQSLVRIGRHRDSALAECRRVAPRLAAACARLPPVRSA